MMLEFAGVRESGCSEGSAGVDLELDNTKRRVIIETKTINKITSPGLDFRR